MSVSEKIEIIQGDITKVNVDVIVNAANSSLLGGGGVDGAIHRAGGPEILAECRAIVARQGGCKTGEAVITGAGRLPAKFVIHTVGPVWNNGHRGESELLSRCYKNSLTIAANHHCSTIAFPNISTGIYRFPKSDAAKISVEAVNELLPSFPVIQKVLFVCFDEENFILVQQQIKSLANGNSHVN